MRPGLFAILHEPALIRVLTVQVGLQYFEAIRHACCRCQAIEDVDSTAMRAGNIQIHSPAPITTRPEHAHFGVVRMGLSALCIAGLLGATFFPETIEFLVSWSPGMCGAPGTRESGGVWASPTGDPRDYSRVPTGPACMTLEYTDDISFWKRNILVFC